MDTFWRDVSILLSGVPYLNLIVLKINFEDYWEDKCYPKMLKLYVSFLRRFSYNENTGKKTYQFKQYDILHLIQSHTKKIQQEEQKNGQAEKENDAGGGNF